MLARVALFEGADVFISLLSQTEVFCLFFLLNKGLLFFEKKQQQRSSVTAIATRELVSW